MHVEGIMHTSEGGVDDDKPPRGVVPNSSVVVCDLHNSF